MNVWTAGSLSHHFTVSLLDFSFIICVKVLFSSDIFGTVTFFSFNWVILVSLASHSLYSSWLSIFSLQRFKNICLLFLVSMSRWKLSGGSMKWLPFPSFDFSINLKSFLLMFTFSLLKLFHLLAIVLLFIIMSFTSFPKNSRAAFLIISFVTALFFIVPRYHWWESSLDVPSKSAPPPPSTSKKSPKGNMGVIPTSPPSGSAPRILVMNIKNKRPYLILLILISHQGHNIVGSKLPSSCLSLFFLMWWYGEEEGTGAGESQTGGGDSWLEGWGEGLEGAVGWTVGATYYYYY